MNEEQTHQASAAQTSDSMSSQPASSDSTSEPPPPDPFSFPLPEPEIPLAVPEDDSDAPPPAMAAHHKRKRKTTAVKKVLARQKEEIRSVLNTIILQLENEKMCEDVVPALLTSVTENVWSHLVDDVVQERVAVQEMISDMFTGIVSGIVEESFARQEMINDIFTCIVSGIVDESFARQRQVAVDQAIDQIIVMLFEWLFSTVEDHIEGLVNTVVNEVFELVVAELLTPVQTQAATDNFVGIFFNVLHTLRNAPQIMLARRSDVAFESDASFVDLRDRAIMHPERTRPRIHELMLASLPNNYFDEVFDVYEQNRGDDDDDLACRICLESITDENIPYIAPCCGVMICSNCLFTVPPNHPCFLRALHRTDVPTENVNRGDYRVLGSILSRLSLFRHLGLNFRAEVERRRDLRHMTNLLLGNGNGAAGGGAAGGGF